MGSCFTAKTASKSDLVRDQGIARAGNQKGDGEGGWECEGTWRAFELR